MVEEGEGQGRIKSLREGANLFHGLAVELTYEVGANWVVSPDVLFNRSQGRPNNTLQHRLSHMIALEAQRILLKPLNIGDYGLPDSVSHVVGLPYLQPVTQLTMSDVIKWLKFYDISPATAEVLKDVAAYFRGTVRIIGASPEGDMGFPFYRSTRFQGHLEETSSVGVEDFIPVAGFGTLPILQLGGTPDPKLYYYP